MSTTTLRPACTCMGDTVCAACQTYSPKRHRGKAHARPLPAPAALIAAALTGIPERWREPDSFGPGPYLWHCQTWQPITGTPHTCPYCQQRFFTEEPAI